MATRPFSLLFILVALSVVVATPGRAAPQSNTLNQSFAQAQKQRPHLRINRYPFRRHHAVYPLAYDVEYPGPNGVRHCVNRYVTERRPSGSVLVPHMRCTWVVRR